MHFILLSSFAYIIFHKISFKVLAKLYTNWYLPFSPGDVDDLPVVSNEKKKKDLHIGRNFWFYDSIITVFIIQYILGLFRKILFSLGMETNLYRIGQSKVFFRSGVVAALEENREKRLSQIIIHFQAICRGFMARQMFQKRVEQSNAIRIIQRNGHAWLRLRNWQWWRLFSKVRCYRKSFLFSPL